MRDVLELIDNELRSKVQGVRRGKASIEDEAKREEKSDGLEEKKSREAKRNELKPERWTI